VDAIESIVAQAARSERASVANAVVQDPPGVGKVIAVLAKHAQHFQIMMRLLISKAKGAETGDSHLYLILHVVWLNT